MPRKFVLLALLAIVAFAVPAEAVHAATPSAKRCKAVKAKKRKTKKDRALLAKCRKPVKQPSKKAATKPQTAAPAVPLVPTPLLPGVIAPESPSAGATPAPTPSPAATPTPAPEVPPLPVGTGRAVQVRGSEWRLSLSRAQVLAGTVRVEFNLTSAEDPHTLVLSRVDGTGPTYHFAEQGSGSVSAQSLALDAGRWRLVCDLPGHEDAGMKTELDVR